MILIFFQFEPNAVYDDFLRIVNFILMFFQEELYSLLVSGKPSYSNLEG